MNLLLHINPHIWHKIKSLGLSFMRMYKQKFEVKWNWFEPFFFCCEKLLSCVKVQITLKISSILTTNFLFLIIPCISIIIFSNTMPNERKNISFFSLRWASLKLMVDNFLLSQMNHFRRSLVNFYQARFSKKIEK